MKRCNKLALRHNERAMMQERIGVKVKNKRQTIRKKSPNAHNYIQTAQPSISEGIFANYKSFDNSTSRQNQPFINTFR